MSVLLGPSLGGIFYVFGAPIPLCHLRDAGDGRRDRKLPAAQPAAIRRARKVSWESLVAGFRFIWRCKAVLGAMLLDLVATLFGGVTALLPIYARDILDIGAMGRRRLAQRAGGRRAARRNDHDAHSDQARTAAFLSMSALRSMAPGTIVFGLSTNVALSIVALAVLGCAATW